MADAKEKVKLRRIVSNEREAFALDKVNFDSSNNTLTLYSSFDPTIKEETTISIPTVELDSDLEERGKAADAKAVGDAVRAVKAMIGTPLTANSASDMIDTTKIYVYTGEVWKKMENDPESKKLIENNEQCGVCKKGYTNKPF